MSTSPAPGCEPSPPTGARSRCPAKRSTPSTSTTVTPSPSTAPRAPPTTGAHVLAAGGGRRELAYVALSRARTGTTLYTVADDLDQARHDLGIDWSNDHHQRWIADTATPALRPSTPEAKVEQSPEQRRLDALRDDLRDLYAGRGRWQHTPEGANARTRNELRAHLDAAECLAAHPNTRRRDRRSARREADTLAPILDAAEVRWHAVGQPAADDLNHTITKVEADIERDDLARRRQYLAPSSTAGPQAQSPSSKTCLRLATTASASDCQAGNARGHTC